jgi:cytochrome c2
MNRSHHAIAFACALPLIVALTASRTALQTASRTVSHTAPRTAPQTASRPPSAPGSAANGERLFARKCAGCHSLVEHRTGPRLGDVYGRRAGSAAGFRYSDSVARQTFIWSDSTLDAWLSGPRDFIAGAAMPARIDNAQERADIIAYLRAVTLSTDPARRAQASPSIATEWSVR